MSAPRVLIHAQHLLGIGHLQRAAALARALAGRGCAVTLLSGGMPVPDLNTGGARLVQLPPVRSADAAFSGLADGDGRPVDASFLAARTRQVLDTFERAAPDVLVTETYPFGRRQLRGELAALVEAADRRRPRPLVVASVRDILQTGRAPERLAETAARVRRDYDLVLVHGDPRFARLDETFPPATAIADRCAYTGFVDAAPATGAEPTTVGQGRGAVLVSAGGGAVGRQLFATALQARAAGVAADRPWRLLVGGDLPEAAYQDLGAQAGGLATVARARPDFRALLRGAALSISQAGYNTAVDLLATRVPAVVVPFAAGGQTEQAFRARRLAALGLAIAVEPDILTAETLAGAIGQARAGDPAPHTLNLCGAEASADILLARLSARRAAAG